MKKRWSSLSTPDCYQIEVGTLNHTPPGSNLTPYQIKDEDGKEIGCDKWENEYHTRSKVNDETLKKKHILFLGDSFVYGHGVARGNTVSDFFDIYISDDYSCFNLGVPGTGFDTGLLRLQQWCNAHGDQVHAIYFGLSELSRHRHWEWLEEDWKWSDSVYTEDKYFYDSVRVDFSPEFREAKGRDFDPTNKRVISIRKNYSKLLSKVNSVAKLDATVMAVINLSKVYNFNVYFFNTNSSNLPDEDETVLKEQTENYNIKWSEGSHLDPTMRVWDRHNSIIVNNDTENKRQDSLWNSYFIKNDGHWSSKGCKMVANEIFDETKQWY
jgi:hypothetical protein